VRALSSGETVVLMESSSSSKSGLDEGRRARRACHDRA